MRIYLDHNATAPLRPEALAALAEAFGGDPRTAPGNPSSLHASGRRARQLVDSARERIAAALSVHEDQVLFTSGGTESIHLAMRGILAARGAREGLASARTEHSAVRETATALSREGRPHVVLPVDTAGAPLFDRWQRDPLYASVGLCCASAANQETGATADLGGVRVQLDQHPGRPALFVDGVQALGRLPLGPVFEAADAVAFSAHKAGGPVGVGLLVTRPGLALAPVVVGGGQERGLRPGTENAPGVWAAAAAIEAAVRERAEFAARCTAWLEELRGRLADGLARVEFVGPPLGAPRLPNTLCVLPPPDEEGRLPEGRTLVLRLDLEGLEVSAGSACASGSLEPSPVLLAIGYDEARARSALRISLGWTTTREDCQRAGEILVSVLGPSRAKRGGNGPL